jgi:hypothetical protein
MFQICIQEVHWPERDKTVLVSFFFLFNLLSYMKQHTAMHVIVNVHCN